MKLIALMKKQRIALSVIAMAHQHVRMVRGMGAVGISSVLLGQQRHVIEIVVHMHIANVTNAVLVMMSASDQFPVPSFRFWISVLCNLFPILRLVLSFES